VAGRGAATIAAVDAEVNRGRNKGFGIMVERDIFGGECWRIAIASSKRDFTPKFFWTKML